MQPLTNLYFEFKPVCQVTLEIDLMFSYLILHTVMENCCNSLNLFLHAVPFV